MRRPDEQAAIDVLFNSLQTENRVPIEDTTIEDNPDCVFEVSGIRVAAECTNINLEALMKWSNSKRRLVKDKQYEIKFALEPHYWIKESIAEKEPKLETYKANGRANEVWLIAHALEQPTNFDCTDTTIAIMRDAVRFLNPDFDEVWFVHAEYSATRLWRKGDPKAPEFPRWDTSENKYPFESIIMGRSTITKEGLNVTVTFGDSVEKIDLKPLDSTWSNES